MSNWFTNIFKKRQKVSKPGAYTQTFTPTRYGQMTTGSKSPGGLSSTGMGRLYDHKSLRANVREMMYDSVHCKTLATRFADTIVNTGLKLRLEPNFRILGITQEAASEWSTSNSERFHLWAKSKDSDRAGVNNFYQNQHLYSFMQQRDNDMFIRLHYSKNRKLISPLQIQFLDADQINGDGYTSTSGYNAFNDGIKRDKTGKETSYDVSVFDGKNYVQKNISAFSKSGRIQMLHGYKPESAGEQRGKPLYSHLIQELEQITDFKQSHISQAINQSQIMAYVKPSNDAPSSNPMADMARPAGPKPSDFLGSNPSCANEITSEESLEFNLMDEATFRQPGSTFLANLNSGEDIGTIESTAPSDSFDMFVNAFISHLSASVSMPIEVMLMKFGQNYSASRATLVLLWRVLQQWQAEMAADYMDKVVEMWISEEIAAGRITAPGWSDPRMRAAWCNCRWIGSAIPSIDPKKEADADARRIEIGSTTLDDTAMNYNGSNGESNRAKLKKELPELLVPAFSANYRFSPAAAASTGENNGEPITTDTND